MLITSETRFVLDFLCLLVLWFLPPLQHTILLKKFLGFLKDCFVTARLAKICQKIFFIKLNHVFELLHLAYNCWVGGCIRTSDAMVYLQYITNLCSIVIYDWQIDRSFWTNLHDLLVGLYFMVMGITHWNKIIISMSCLNDNVTVKFNSFYNYSCVCLYRIATWSF